MLCSADVTEHMHNPKMLQSWLTDSVGKAIESNFSHYLHRKTNKHACSTAVLIFIVFM